MGTIWVREFTGGLDTRKMPETTPGGALVKAVDGHINRGGEFEKRAAFVEAYQLPVGTTKSLARGSKGLYVFGHAAPLGIPTGITYQRLQHPNGVTALVRVLSYDLFSAKIYATALFADGSVHHFYDGTLVADWQDVRARVTFSVGGAPGGSLTALTVNGVSVIASAVTWETSNEITASAIAAAVNNFYSSVDYTAVANGDKVSILSVATGTGPNGYAVVATVSGTFVVTPGSSTLASGAAQPANTFQPGNFVRTIGAKVYALSGPNLHFSGVRLPDGWVAATDVGAGFIDMSAEASGSEELRAVVKYQQYIAVFAAETTQIWSVDPDPLLNKQYQVLGNTGTVSGRSVVQFGDGDVFYLDESGVRSLRARNASNAAATSDVGVAIDTLIVDKLKTLTAQERETIFGVIEPRDGRFWLAVKDIIYVFSFFPGSKVSAWTTYLPSVEVAGEQVAFEVDDIAVFKRRVYIRSGDVIYSYGGLGEELTYDSVEPEIWLPLLDGDEPTMGKTLDGVDVACEGNWLISMAMQPTDVAASDEIAEAARTTYNHGRLSAVGNSTHFGPRLRGKGDGAAKVGSVVIHYTSDDDGDGKDKS